MVGVLNAREQLYLYKYANGLPEGVDKKLT